VDKTVPVPDGQAFVPLVIKEATRYPHAYAAPSSEGWAVRCLHGESVVPENVTVAYPELYAERSKPIRLRTTADDAYDSLLDAVLSPDAAEAAAQALADHCGRHPANLLFCRAHGLPVDHLTPEEYIERPGRSPQTQCDPSESLRVNDVQRMLTTLTAIDHMAARTTRWRTPTPRREVEDALRWPLLALNERESIERQTGKTGKLPVAASRWLIKRTVDELYKQTRTDFGYYWLPQYGFRLVCMARTDLGIYAAAFVSRILRAAQVGARPLHRICASCGDVLQPRSSDQQYCSKPECQRAHAARNKRREREHAKDLKQLKGGDR
jgi:hypothetical protein